jgi:hypothetical protein
LTGNVDSKSDLDCPLWDLKPNFTGDCHWTTFVSRINFIRYAQNRWLKPMCSVQWQSPVKFGFKSQRGQSKSDFESTLPVNKITLI